MGTLNEAILTARNVLQDEDATNYRHLTSDLLRYGNDAIDQIAILKPQLFGAVGEFLCVQNETIQTIGIADSLGIIDILYIKNGEAVTKAERQHLDRIKPGWPTAAAGPAKHWIPMQGDPYRFMVYPKAPANQVLIGTYVSVPPEYTQHQELPLPSPYVSIISDYIVGIASALDSTHVDSGRAKMFISMFFQKLGARVPTEDKKDKRE